MHLLALASVRTKGIMNSMFSHLIRCIAISWLCLSAGAEPIRVPAFTAYLEPNVSAERVSERTGIEGWTGNTDHILWSGRFSKTGEVECAVSINLREGSVRKFSLECGGKTNVVEVRADGTNVVQASFGRFPIPSPGYQRFVLRSLNAPEESNGAIQSLLVDGAAAEGAVFNLKPRRNAASVHMRYPIPEDIHSSAFYCEATAKEEPIHTFYMAAGWRRGYFGMQVNGPKKRRIIFSVWDSGNEAVDRSKVGDDNRVKLMAKGEGVVANDFGNEGTGGHSHLVYPWKTGDTQRFLITAQPTNDTFTIYTGYYFHPGKSDWVLIASFRAPKDGVFLKGLHSFSENFVGVNGHLPRKCLYGNQWVRTDDGKWIELTKASFSHDATGKADRLDRSMGVEDGQFYLLHGGFGNEMTAFGATFDRPATKYHPDISTLPWSP